MPGDDGKEGGEEDDEVGDGLQSDGQPAGGDEGGVVAHLVEVDLLLVLGDVDGQHLVQGYSSGQGRAFVDIHF